MDALKKHPWRQIGAAILDAAALYGSCEGVKSLNNGDGDGDRRVNSRDISINVEQSNNTIIQIDGIRPVLKPAGTKTGSKDGDRRR